MGIMRKGKKYLKQLLILYAIGYAWKIVKKKIWEKGKKKTKKEVKIN
jgi:hypothetical protein